MSLNDFEYVDLTEKAGSTFSSFKEGDKELFEISIAKAILKRQEAYRALDAMVDATGESWFDLGTKLERRRTLEILDSFERKLLDSEEDAKMTLAILRELIESAEDEEDGTRD